MVPVEQMAAYLSAQVNALRYFSATTAQPLDHWGFAWAPRNTTGSRTPTSQRRRGNSRPARRRDPRLGRRRRAGESGKRRVRAGRDALRRRPPEARHNEAWRSFRAWAQSTLTISGAPATLAAGVASPPLQLSLASAVSRPAERDAPLELAGRGLRDDHAGPWTTTLTLPVAPGSGRGLLLPRHPRRQGDA